MGHIRAFQAIKDSGLASKPLHAVAAVAFNQKQKDSLNAALTAQCFESAGA
jgi:hypothetical protein